TAPVVLVVDENTVVEGEPRAFYSIAGMNYDWQPGTQDDALSGGELLIPTIWSAQAAAPAARQARRRAGPPRAGRRPRRTRPAARTAARGARAACGPEWRPRSRA